MKDKIELFSEKLIDENKDLALEVLGYAQKFGKSQGWHYVLDMIWVLKELENKKGGTILAAGAGLGLLQFILAARGYRMVSVDVNQRKKPVFIENIYHVQYMGTEADITHPFLEWHQLKREGGKATQNEAENPSGLPTIIFYHADLHNMELLKDNSIDAVVSISALEHNPPEKLEGVVSELGRVLKHNGKMYLTVSTAKEDFFHEASCSWILNETGLAGAYQLREGYQSNFQSYDEIFSGICQSQRLKNWLASFHYRSDKNGMPNGIWKPEYQPVGVLKVNDKK